MLDPRFAYDESIFSKANWNLIEEDLIEFAHQKINIECSTRVEEAMAAPLEDLDSLVEDTGSASDDSIKFDIWKPKSPGSVSVPSIVSGTSHSSHQSQIQLKLASYKALGRTTIDTDIFVWWKEVGAQFPDLFVLARIVHSIPATSVSSERLFSKAGLIYGNTLRNRLSGEMAQKILLIKANMDQLFLAPSTEPVAEEEELDFAYLELNDNEF
ncbi:hypothetical protein niasHT_033896 [Heterodera trifolii]|uniref:HAT C-terminal dimerisation domain-containing protein n=1 Tax=Heterodera trifolii TaxID=157864 RepID=A0ABD2HXJ1_9BILA